MPAFQSTNFLFTINWPSIDNEGDDPSEWPDVRYCVYQLEEGESGNVHFQGYVVWTKKKTLTACKEISPRAHWEVRRGTHEEARNYCIKQEGRLDEPVEVGDPPVHQGKRSDIATTWTMIKSGASNFELLEANPGAMRFARGIEWARAALPVPDRRCGTTIVNVYWGVAGSGKSFRAYAEAGADAYVKPPGSKWFDGYNGQRKVVFDEFDGSWFTWTTFLRLLDGPMSVETKGGMRQFLADEIWITSNKAPDVWYIQSMTPVMWGALQRRMRNVVQFTEPYVPPNGSPPVDAPAQ